MSQYPGSSTPSVSPFTGLVPTRMQEAESGNAAPRSTSRADAHRTGVGIGFAATMPLVLVGTLAMTVLSPTTPLEKPKAETADPSTTIDLTASITAPSASSAARPTTSIEIETTSLRVPATYIVKSGDTISEIAAHYGLSTASVLALNGLSWKSLIFPKQVLRLKKTSSSATPPAKPPVVKPPVTTPPVSTSPGKPPVTPPVTTPPTTTPPSVSTPKPTTTTKYTIRSGDTITSIAKKFGVSVQAILTANGLKVTSIIYAGRTLLIPGASTPGGSTSSGGSTGGGTTSGSGGSTGGGTAPAGTGTTQTIVPLSASMETNAKTIIAVGKSLGVPSYGLVVALAAAMQESGLQDLHYGDSDSVGLFQQRPSAGWGTAAQLENTTYASELFFGGPKNPNKGKTRGLLDIAGWQSMTVTQAAQAVQISATPNAYAKWEASARAWVTQLG